MDWVGRATSVFLYIVFLLVSNSNVYAEQRVVCYYTNWSVYRPGTAKFSPQNINPYLCTHLIYAFGGFTKDNTLKPFDKYQDIEKGGYAKFTGLKTYNKKLKTMLAIGGWNEGSTRFSPLVADPERREELVKNTIKFLRQNHFDGLDLDWEYPAFRDGGKPRDRDNYADFVQELRDEFERESSKTGRPRLLLSMAIPAGIEYLEKGYDLPRLNEYLDFFNLLSYDYHSAFEPAVNHHSPLYGLEEDNEYNYDSELTIDYTISYLLNHEVTPNKLVLGIPTYGRSYTLFNDEATEIGAPADGPGEEGDATREKGYLAYYEICENIAKSDEWEVVQPNPKAMGPYAVRGNQWVGYDDEEIVRIKAQYVNEKGLGGIMFWSIDNDDFRGKCHDRPYPLIEAAKEAMLAGNNRKSRPSQKPKLISNRKKTRLQSDNHRSEDDLTRRRLRTETNKRHPSSTTPSTRKRISSLRTNSRSNGKSRVNVEENDEEHIENVETEGYSVKSRNKSRPRSRTNKIASRRKAQSTKSNDDNDDDLDDAVEYKEKSSTTPEPPTTPDPGSDFKCQDEGFFPHPRDCKKYFWCLDSGPSGLGIVANQFTCPSGLVFNKIADSCDYPRNVICPKTKTSSPVSTTKAPITTTRATFQHRTTKRTTTTAAPNSDEEYEYDDDESHDVEDEEDNEEDEVINKNSVRSTTAKPLIYKTITRNRSTASTTTTTTEIPTTVVSRNFKSNTHKVLDLEDEEDPRVIKELIDLIKKAGGLEHLEKQLNLQEKYSPVKTNDTKDEEHITPATISRSLYERVLNRQATRIGGLFGSSTTRTIPKNDVTEKITINSRVNYQNGPGGAQFEGLDDVPEVRSLRRTNKPQYVTIERPKPLSIQPSFSDEEMDDDELPQRDGIEQDNADVASSEEQTISNPDNENDDENDDINDTSTKKATPSYVNIRRTRPSTSANENDLGDKDELSGNTTPTIRSNEAIENQEEKESTPKSRYTNTQRFRSTTANSAEDKSKSNTEDSSTISNDPLIPSNIQEIRTNPEKITISPSFSSSTIQSTTKLTTESVNKSSSFPILTMTARSAINASQTSINFDPIVTIIENFVTEIPETTLSISTTPKITLTSTSKTTTTVSQPRPFGFPRRGRPTTTTSSTTTSSSPTTEQNRVKVSNIPTRNFVRLRARTRATTESTTVKAHNHHDDDKIADDELNREKVVNRPNTIARRRGSSRYTKAAHRSTVNETSSNFISSRSTEPTVVVTTDSVSKRRRGRPTTETIEQPITESNKRRRRPISRSSTDPLTDSPIIRISPRNFNAEPIVKSERGGFKNNSINSQEEITNIKVIRISNHIDDNDNDSLNAVEATSLINTDWKTSTIIPDGTTIDYTESTTEITSEDEIVSTPNAINSVFNSDFNSSTETTTIPTQIISTKAHEPVRRKVLLRRRLLVPTSTTESTDEQTTFRPNRRRKVIRRLGPVSPNSIDDITNAPEISTTEIPIQSTIFEENFDVTTEDTMVETIDVDYTNSILATEPTTNDADTIFTNDATEQNTQSINNDIELEESTTMGYSQINYSPETDTIISTSVSSTTIDDKPISRFIRKKFIRKRPADLTSTTPSSTTSTRRLGSSRFSTSSQSVNSGSNNLRRKNVFIRKRPVYPAATTQQSIDETLEENSNSRNRNFINLPNNTAVELKYFKELPTLKELIDNNSVINRNIAESSSIKYSKGIHIPVRILNDLQNDEIKDDQFAILQLPEDTVNSTIQRNILTIQLINHSNYENNTETKINFENVTEVNLINHTTEDFTSVTNYETPSTQHIIRGFYVTKSLDESQPKPSTTYEPEDVTKNTISENIPTDSSESTDFTTDDNYSEEYTTNEYLEDTSTLSPITITNESNNSSELINEIEDFEDETRNYSTTDSTSSILITTLPTISLSFSPPPPPKERRPVKEIVVHRRPTTRQLTQSKRRRLIAVHRNKIAANTDEVPRPGNWSTRIIRKRPITESINDQNIAESQPQQSVTLIKSPAILHDVFNTSRIEDVNATVEINLFRSPGTLLRKPGNIARSDLRDRFKSSLRNPTVGNVRVSETQYSNKTSADTYDQSSRAQELLPVSIADPPTITSTIEAGNETPTRIRGIQRHKIEVTYDVYTEPPTIVRTTIEPFRRRQRPAQNEDKINIDVTSPRSRRPAIIDYDYYVDEEVRLSIKPELKNKIYITRTGGIRCLDQGSFAHPTSCKKFITCAPMVGGQVIATEYTCPAKLSFDPVGGICNWSAGLGCKEPSDS